MKTTYKQFDNATGLKQEMLYEALKVMTSKETDLIIDFEYVDSLSKNDHPSWFFWCVLDNCTRVFFTLADLSEFGGCWVNKALISAIVGYNSNNQYEILYVTL